MKKDENMIKYIRTLLVIKAIKIKEDEVDLIIIRVLILSIYKEAINDLIYNKK